MFGSKPNWLLRGLVILSLAVHFLIFVHISGIYRSNALSYIELTMQDFSKPSARSIPRPRKRPKNPPPTDAIKRVKPTKLLPQPRPIKIDPVEKDLPDTLVERIAVPEIPGTPGLSTVDWDPGDLEGASGDFTSPQSYLEMVRLKIERHKNYPDAAMSRQIEGKTQIRFVITPDGHVRDVEIVKTSRHDVLDRAAVSAVKAAAPFPRPPARFFKGRVCTEIKIVFELM